MTATPTAATPEELAEACIADMDGCTYRGRVDAIAAAIRQHSEALRAENERLSERNEYLLSMFPPHRAEGEFGGYCRHPDLPADADEADRLARKVCDAISGVFVGTDVDYRASHERRVAGYLRGAVLGKEKAEARATTAEAALAAMTAERDRVYDNVGKMREAGERALAASLERERGMREALTMFTKARYQIANRGPANTWSLDRLHEAWVKACDCLPMALQENKP
ncbi:hypothetical protein TSA6c_00340 [Azospirillum sp. TSA6c]|uniref:hypothetical protein n=1 Tax=Azospirillum sp. TSA6c TaxID=709813 RepID=UPI000D622236|nr:hypothetical protein [Azospirillum sp. TSA6c]PWC54410.1 hypothetical protein TSA6c_00340 [Azospirillum sp. TSA6c]